MAIAKNNLFVNGVLAHTEGDYVPDDNVEPNGWGDQVDDGYPESAVNLQQYHESLKDEPLPVGEQQVADQAAAQKAQAPAPQASGAKAQAQPNQ